MLRKKDLLGVTAIVLFFVTGAAAIVFADTSIDQLFSQIEQEYSLPSGILAKVAYVESGGNASATSKTSSAAGLFQWLPNSWEAATKALYGAPLNTSERFSPSVAAKVTAFELAQAKTQIGSLITQAHIDMTVGLYLAHFLGVGGARKFLTAYISDPSQNACSLFPKGCAANGSVLKTSLSGVINYFAGKLGQPGVIQVAGNFQDAMGVSYAYSYADISSSSFLPTSTQIGVDSAYDYAPTYAPANSSLAVPNYNSSNILQPGTIGTPTSGGSATSNSSGTSASSGSVSVPSEAIIIAQPSSVSAGQSVAVSWSTVGMSANNLCQVGSGTTLLAQANGGTLSASTTAAESGTTLTFGLICINGTGATVNRSASVSVR